MVSICCSSKTNSLTTAGAFNDYFNERALNFPSKLTENTSIDLALLNTIKPIKASPTKITDSKT